jgi:hypothetical protein
MLKLCSSMQTASSSMRMVSVTSSNLSRSEVEISELRDSLSFPRRPPGLAVPYFEPAFLLPDKSLKDKTLRLKF